MLVNTKYLLAACFVVDHNGPIVEAPTISAPQNRITWKRSTIRMLRFALILYLLVVLLLSWNQERLIFAGHRNQGLKHTMVRPGENEELIRLKSADGTDVVALFGKALTPDNKIREDAASRPTIIFFYGSGNCVADVIGMLRKFRRQGANVICPDFIGYGMSGGEPSETGFYATADTVYDYLPTRHDIDPKRFIPMGWSLGGTAAIHLASTHNVAALVTISTFTSMADEGRVSYPFFPASFFLRHRFENERHIANVSCPVLIFHGTEDDLIPFSMSARLAAACNGHARVIPIEGGRHNNAIEVGEDQILDALTRLVDESKK